MGEFGIASTNGIAKTVIANAVIGHEGKRKSVASISEVAAGTQLSD